MHNFMAILSQLFWGVTIGALSAAFETLAKGAMMIGGLGSAGWYGLKWRKARRQRDDQHK
ncbi:hypothetical protein [Novosphingobium gossypii]|uniref:hypothetical protein n=1 Tax=Novosphingobium gossypii TaxID=1604774 RepID=UPI003D1D4C80